MDFMYGMCWNRRAVVDPTRLSPLIIKFNTVDV